MGDFDSKEFFDGTELEDRGNVGMTKLTASIITSGIHDTQRGETENMGIRDGNALDSF